MNRWLLRTTMMVAVVAIAPLVSAGKLRGTITSSTTTVPVISPPPPEPTIVLEESATTSHTNILINNTNKNSSSTSEEEDADYPSEVPVDDVNGKDEPTSSLLSSTLSPFVFSHPELAGHVDLENLQTVLEKEPVWILARDDHGWTMLHEAARGGHLEVCQYLLDKGAEINAETHLGSTPLYSAVKHHGKDSPIVHYLVSRGALIKEPRPQPLPAGTSEMSIEELIHARLPHILAAEGRLEDLKHLVQLKEETAAFMQDSDRVLGTNSILLRAPDQNGWTPLHEAARFKHLPVIRYLVEERKVDVDPLTHSGATPMYYARILHGQGSPAEQLLQSYGAHIRGPPHALFNSTQAVQ